MKILCIDTSEKSLFITIASEGKIFNKYQSDCGLMHSQTLLAGIDSLLKENILSLRDMDYFCCCIGPGSFTGIRIGITTIRAFAQIYKKPALSVNSLQLKAYNIEIKGNIVIPLIDAMQKKVYYAAYYDGAEVISPSICKADNLSEEVSKRLYEIYGKNIEVKYIYEKNIEGLKTVSPVKPPLLAEICLKYISQGKAAGYENMVPLYAALCQAEISYADKHKKME